MNQAIQLEWPALPFEDFKSTAHLLHMSLQAVGKLKLHTPFEPHWANVAFWITATGLSTGLMHMQNKTFSVDFDMIKHQIIFKFISGETENIQLGATSVAQLTDKIFSVLKKHAIHVEVNPKPQEIANPILFHEDTTIQNYDNKLANTWWHILTNIQLVMQQYHAHFDGESPPIGLMWGTFDIRDARYNGKAVPTTGINSGFIRRNAMNEAQVEIGWWPGNEMYPRPAFYSFTYPAPAKIEQAKIKPAKAHWDAKLSEFVLDYDDLRALDDPGTALLDFFNSTYAAGSTLAKWDKKLDTIGEPV